MLKMVYCVRRVPGMSEEDFHPYWREVHGPLALECLPVMGACKYVQTHTVLTPLNEMIKEMKGQTEAFDGIAEIWWDDMDALMKAMDSEKWQEVQDRLFNNEKKGVYRSGPFVFVFLHRRTGYVAMPVKLKSIFQASRTLFYLKVV